MSEFDELQTALAAFGLTIDRQQWDQTVAFVDVLESVTHAAIASGSSRDEVAALLLGLIATGPLSEEDRGAVSEEVEVWAGHGMVGDVSLLCCFGSNSACPQPL